MFERSGQVAVVKDDRSRFRCMVPRDPYGAAQARTHFADWLQRHYDLRERQLSDLILAVNEALADAAEHGGAQDAPQRGSGVEIVATYDQDADMLTVQIASDDREHAPTEASLTTTHPNAAGCSLGTDLMRLLADETQIHTAPGQRTQILLTWNTLHHSLSALLDDPRSTQLC